MQGIPPYGANLQYVDKYVKKVDDVLRNNAPEIIKRLSTSSVPGESFTYCVLKPWEQRTRRSQQVVDSLRDPLSDVTGISAYASVGGKSLVGGVTDKPFDIVLQTTKSYAELINIAETFEQTLARMKIVEGIFSDYGSEGQELVISVDREKAASLGVEVSTVAETLESLINGRSATKFERESKLYPAKVWVEEQYRRNPEDLFAFYVRGVKDKHETMVPLAELISVQKRQAPISIMHYGGMKAVNFSAKLREGVSLGTALEKTREKVQEVFSTTEARLAFSGESRRYLEESSNLLLYLWIGARLYLSRVSGAIRKLCGSVDYSVQRAFVFGGGRVSFETK